MRNKSEGAFKYGLVRHELIKAELCESDLKNMCGRYHFDDIGLPLLRKVYKNYMENCMVSAYFSVSEKEPGRAAVLMTLGKGIDDMQNRLMEEGKLSEAYMVECIAMELLTRAYALGDEILHKQTGWWCGQYEFPGADQPLEAAAEIVDAFGETEVSYNNAYVLFPKKSTAFIIRMQKEKPDRKREQLLCAGCTNQKCEKRLTESKELNYGYRRIFGERGGNRCRKD